MEEEANMSQKQWLLLKRLVFMLQSGSFIRTRWLFHIKRRGKEMALKANWRAKLFCFAPHWLWQELH